MYRYVRNRLLKLYKWFRFKVIGKRTTYQSGPMEFAVDTCNVWRKDCIEMLKGYNIQIINPVTSEKEKVGLPVKESMKKMKGWVRSGHRTKFKNSMHRVKVMDLQAVKTSDFIICYWNNSIRTIGTISELDWAEEYEIPVYTFTPDNLTDISLWLLFDILGSGGEVKHSLKQIIELAISDFNLKKKGDCNECIKSI